MVKSDARHNSGFGEGEEDWELCLGLRLTVTKTHTCFVLKLKNKPRFLGVVKLNETKASYCLGIGGMRVRKPTYSESWAKWNETHSFLVVV